MLEQNKDTSKARVKKARLRSILWPRLMVSWAPHNTIPIVTLFFDVIHNKPDHGTLPLPSPKVCKTLKLLIYKYGIQKHTTWDKKKKKNSWCRGRFVVKSVLCHFSCQFSRQLYFSVRFPRIFRANFTKSHTLVWIFSFATFYLKFFGIKVFILFCLRYWCSTTLFTISW